MRNPLKCLFNWIKSFILWLFKLDVGDKTGEEAKRELTLKWTTQGLFFLVFISFNIICTIYHTKQEQLISSRSKAYNSEASYMITKEIESSAYNILESSKLNIPYVENWNEIKTWRVFGIIYILVVYLLYKFGMTNRDGERIFNVLDVTFFSILISFTGGLNSIINYFFICSILLAAISYWFTRDVGTLKNRNCSLLAYLFALVLNHFWANWETKSIKLTKLLPNLFQHYLFGLIVLVFLLILLKYISARFIIKGEIRKI